MNADKTKNDDSELKGPICSYSNNNIIDKIINSQNFNISKAITIIFLSLKKIIENQKISKVKFFVFSCFIFGWSIIFPISLLLSAIAKIG